jgi:hypothetical protein
MDLQVEARFAPQCQGQHVNRILQGEMPKAIAAGPRAGGARTVRCLALYARGLHRRFLPANDPVAFEIDPGRPVVPDGFGPRNRCTTVAGAGIHRKERGGN